jgi:hypothetical protein
VGVKLITLYNLALIFEIVALAVQKKGKEVDPVRVFAERELDTRWAILQEARVEYFRGKDFITVLRAHPELIKPLGIEAAIEDVELDIGNILIKRKLIMRCDRVSKTPRPGKTKLSKWPARIEIDQVSFQCSRVKAVAVPDFTSCDWYDHYKCILYLVSFFAVESQILVVLMHFVGG